MKTQTRKVRPQPGDLRHVRMPHHLANGDSLYVVEKYVAPPTFSKGDGKDGGRNLLAAALIGGHWSCVGYVTGTRGAWYAWRETQWTTKGRRIVPALCSYSVKHTVADAAFMLGLPR